jgi:molecular chaperone GrpE (heat shock protein)
MNTEQMAALLGSYAHSVELTLERGGVAVLRPDPGCPFDPALHRAQAVLPAPDPQSDATVATVVSDGYLETVTDRILAPATVRVFRWTEPPAASAQPPTADPISADPLEAPHA